MTTWTQIASMDAPSSNVFAFTGLTLTGYTKLQIVCAGIATGTDATDIKVTLYTGGSEQTGATDYRWGMETISDAASEIDDGDTSDPAALITSNDAGRDVGNASGEGFDALIEIDQPNSTAFHKRLHTETLSTEPGGALVAGAGVGVLQITGATDGIKISGSANLTAGKVRILGLA